MGQKEANENVESNAKIQDDLSQEIVETNIKQLQIEVDQFKNNLEQLQKTRENYNTQWAIDKELWEMQLDGDNHKLVNNTYAYQDNERYWALIKKKIEYKYREDSFVAEQRLKKIDIDEKALKEQLKSSLDKLNELKQEE